MTLSPVPVTAGCEYTMFAPGSSRSRREGVPTAAEVVDPTEGDGEGGARLRLTAEDMAEVPVVPVSLEAAAAMEARKASASRSRRDMVIDLLLCNYLGEGVRFGGLICESGDGVCCRGCAKVKFVAGRRGRKRMTEVAALKEATGVVKRKLLVRPR